MLDWVNLMDICEEIDDVVGYWIYYVLFEGSDFEFIVFIDDLRFIVYDYKLEIGIVGCYVVIVVDIFVNESEFSNIICVDNCLFYQLLNVFMFNGDG